MPAVSAPYCSEQSAGEISGHIIAVNKAEWAWTTGQDKVQIMLINIAEYPPLVSRPPSLTARQI